jgi:ubiquitin carboxyl-terminal hydrolase 7
LDQEPFEILVPKNGTVDDVVMGLQRKLGTGKDGLPDEYLSRIRVYEVHANKIFKECPPSYPVANLTEFIQLLAEVVPEGEMAGEYDEETERPIHVVHFDKDITKMHGTPFIFLMKKVSQESTLRRKDVTNTA